MRKLLWFTVGFAISCLVWVNMLMSEESMLLAVVILVCSFLLMIISRKVPWLKIPSVLLVGAGAAFVWCQVYSTIHLQPAAALDGTIQQLTIQASDYSYETQYGQGVDGKITLEGKDYQVRAYLDTEESVLPGTELKGNFQFKLTTPDGQKENTNFSGKGIFLLAYQRGELSISDGQTDDFSVWAAELRHWIKRVLEELFPEDCIPFAKALLLGDTTELSYETDTHLKLSGIRHVAAVSGLHVSILFALISMVTFRNRYLSAALGLPVLFLFAAVAGFTPSVTRACIMSALMLLGQLLNREYDGMTALAFSVLAMMLCNPMVVTSASLQLSVASVAGIFLFAKPIQQRLCEKRKPDSVAGKLRRWAASSVAVSFSAMLFTVPLCAWYFGTVSLVAALTNLLTLWVISGIFYGLLGVLAFYFIMGQAPVWIVSIVSWATRYVLWVSRTMAGFPLSCVYTASMYVVFWLIFLYVLLAVFIMTGAKHLKVFGCCVLISLSGVLFCGYMEQHLYESSITVLDVGQGQCVLLQSGGKAYLVDCGGDRAETAADKAAAYLHSQGISRLDGVIVTHMDQDHAGGVPYLLTRVSADVVILPPVPAQWNLEEQTVLAADREIHLQWDGGQIRIYAEKMPDSRNENSLCILFDTEKCDILITGDRNGDGENRLLEEADLPEVDLLIAGHHGSKYATSVELLNAVSPEIVCISVGKDNIYGHPAPETIQRLQQFGCEIYRTDIHGSIIIRR